MTLNISVLHEYLTTAMVFYMVAQVGYWLGSKGGWGGASLNKNCKKKPLQVMSCILKAFPISRQHFLSFSALRCQILI